MAWEDGVFCGYSVVTGDKMMDEFGLCLNKIARHYEERFNRKPTLAELLYGFEIAVVSNSVERISDPEMVANMVIKLDGGEHD